MLIRIIFVILLIFTFQESVLAEVTSDNVLDGVLGKYQSVASGWAASIQDRAEWLFWLLVTISMVWTFGFMLLSRADIGEP